MAKNHIAKKKVEGNSITWTWADGSKSVIKLDVFTKELIERSAVHGISQKLGDSYSGAITVVEAKVAFDSVLVALKAGDWNRKGTGTGGIWLEAIARAMKIELADVTAKWDSFTDAKQKIMKSHPDTKLAHAQIVAERAKKAQKAQSDDAPALTLD